MKKAVHGQSFFTSLYQVAKYHICNKETADVVAAFIQKNSKYPKSLLLESNPGMGLLTRSLLEKGVPKIILFERNEEYAKGLLDLCLQSRTSLEKKVMSSVLFGTTYCTSSQQAIRSHMDKLVKDRSTARLFSIFPARQSKYFMSTLVRQLQSSLSFVSSLEFEGFLVISPVAYAEMTSTEKSSVATKYTKYSVLLQTFLDISFITKVKLSCIQPNMPKWTRNSLLKLQDEPNYAYLVKVVPKAKHEFLSGSLELQQAFYFFAMQLIKPSKHIIPVLEKWIPGCGPTFIRHGYDMFLTFRDLKPPEIVQLFIIFSSLKEYPTSVFSHAVEHKISHQGLLSEMLEGKQEEQHEEEEEELKYGVTVDEWENLNYAGPLQELDELDYDEQLSDDLK